MGKMVTVELQREDGLVRYFNGQCVRLQLPKHDAGFAHYQMTCDPGWPSFRQRRNNCIFHGKTPRRADHILDAYLMHDWQTRQLGPLMRR